MTTLEIFSYLNVNVLIFVAIFIFVGILKVNGLIFVAILKVNGLIFVAILIFFAIFSYLKVNGLIFVAVVSADVTSVGSLIKPSPYVDIYVDGHLQKVTQIIRHSTKPKWMEKCVL